MKNEEVHRLFVEERKHNYLITYEFGDGRVKNKITTIERERGVETRASNRELRTQEGYHRKTVRHFRLFGQPESSLPTSSSTIVS